MAADSLQAGNGGICRVARLMAKSLAHAAATHGVASQALTLSDAVPANDLGIPVATAGKNRVRFVLDTWLKQWSHTHVIYDFPGLARAHGWSSRPFMTMIHGIEVWEGAMPQRVRAGQRASLLLTNSEFTRVKAEQLHGGFAQAKLCWLATEEDEPPQNTPTLDQRPPTVLILGRIDHDYYKGHEELVAAWPTVVAAVPNATLLIVGGGPNVARLRATVAASPVKDRIEMAGFVPEADMQRIWDRARVFAMPSKGEGFGLVYVEAMRQGLPVVASVHDAAREINQDGVTGYNVDLGRPGELADRLIRLLHDGDHAAYLGRQGREHWQRHFRYTAFRERFLGLLLPWLKG